MSEYKWLFISITIIICTMIIRSTPCKFVIDCKEIPIRIEKEIPIRIEKEPPMLPGEHSLIKKRCE